MAITQHPTTSPPLPVSAVPATAAEADEPDLAAIPGPRSTVFMTVGWWIGPLLVILAAVVLIVPFLAGLILVALAGTVALPPYLLIRHRRRGRRT